MEEDDVPTSDLDNPDEFAPLTTYQLDLLYEISQQINEPFASVNTDELKEKDDKNNENETNKYEPSNIETSQDFFQWYAKIEDELEQENNIDSKKYYEKLQCQKNHSIQLLNDVDLALQEMNNLSASYTDVIAKTNSLNEISEQLLIDQMNLQKSSDEISKKLQYFTSLTQLSQMLSMPALSVSSSSFFEMLEKIDSCMEYMTANSNYKESYTHLIKYKQHLYTVIHLIKNYVQQVFTTASEQALVSANSKQLESPVQSAVTTDVAFSLYYGKFQSIATKVRPVVEQIEKRADDDADYNQLLSDCQHSYLSTRMHLMNTAMTNTMRQLVDSNRGDNCSLFRSGCTFMLHVCQDETQLYHYFFKDDSPQLTWYLDKLCVHLYDTLRPLIVHINHMETLAELCGILRSEMALADNENAYTRVLWQLLQDVQERLVFRTHVYLQTDLLQYRPSAGDLAYPEKLHMMESIAQSQAEETSQRSSRTGNSPADLHGMWYPTVKRTLVCLSRLYRCVDRPIFQGLSQEALTICVQSVLSASQAISNMKTSVDGELFQIKHLLILREQIAPFQVDFTVKEMSLDFSKVKTAAFSLLQKRSKLFALNGTNALLEFLLEGTPQVREQLLDSRKDVDKQLKQSCEEFIKYCTTVLVGGLNEFLEKAQHVLKMSEQHKTVALQKQAFAKPELVAGIVVDVQRNIKTKLAGIQRSMQLYLANKETEFILFRPIKNNVVSSFVQLEQILAVAEYSSEDLLVVACSTAEQMLE
ncbi:Component of oligomeric golgi complex 3 [Carabus blaptoides fortunei]